MVVETNIVGSKSQPCIELHVARGGVARSCWNILGTWDNNHSIEGRGKCLIDLLVSHENVTKLNERSFHVCEYPIAEANSCTWIKSLIYLFMSETERMRVPCSTSNYREWERFWGTFVLCRRCDGYLSIQSSLSSCLPLLQDTEHRSPSLKENDLFLLLAFCFCLFSDNTRPVSMIRI